MSAGAPTPEVQPGIPPARETHLASTPDLTPFPSGLLEVVDLDEPGAGCRLDGTCD